MIIDGDALLAPIRRGFEAGRPLVTEEVVAYRAEQRKAAERQMVIDREMMAAWERFVTTPATKEAQSEITEGTES